MLKAVAGEYIAPVTDAGDDDPFAFLGLTAAIGGILGALVRAREWKAWVGAVTLPVAAIGTFLSGLSPNANAGQFFITLMTFVIVGAVAFLIVGFGKRGGRGGGSGGSSSRGGGFGGGGFGGGGGSFGGGASGSW